MNGLGFSINDDTDGVRIELAGSLAGVDVETLHQAWQSEAWNDVLKPVIVDITFITDADEHGRALLVVMHRFGAQIIAKSPESFAIAQSILGLRVESATWKPGWFGRLISFFRNDQHGKASLPPQAEMICRILAEQDTPAFTQKIAF